MSNSFLKFFNLDPQFSFLLLSIKSGSSYETTIVLTYVPITMAKIEETETIPAAAYRQRPTTIKRLKHSMNITNIVAKQHIRLIRKTIKRQSSLTWADLNTVEMIFRTIMKVSS